MTDDELGHADDCSVVIERGTQLALYGEIRDFWQDDAVCTCHHWWRYNRKVPPAWYVEQLVGMDQA